MSGRRRGIPAAHPFTVPSGDRRLDFVASAVGDLPNKMVATAATTKVGFSNGMRFQKGRCLQSHPCTVTKTSRKQFDGEFHPSSVASLSVRGVAQMPVVVHIIEALGHVSHRTQQSLIEMLLTTAVRNSADQLEWVAAYAGDLSEPLPPGRHCPRLAESIESDLEDRGEDAV